MNGRQPCPHDDIARFPPRDLAQLVTQGQLLRKHTGQLFRRVSDRYQNRDVLTGDELSAGLPGREHCYHRIGKTITWYDRPRAGGGSS